MRLAVVLSASVVLALAACGGEADAPPPSRTPQEQRTVDSTIGASGLPGSKGVQGALRASDSAAARARQLDSLSRQP